MVERIVPSQRKTPPPAASAVIATRGASAPVGAARREAMIREAAYFLAEHRAFAAGSELEDWFAAERAIDRQLAQGRS